MADIDLTGDIALAIDNAALSGASLVIGYVGDGETPLLSFRGSIHVHSGHQLALWARNPQDGFVAGIAKRSKVALIYFSRDTPGAIFLSIHGRARVAPEVNDAAYAGMIQGERDQDPERKGVAVLIDVDSVQGMGPDGPINQVRAAG